MRDIAETAVENYYSDSANTGTTTTGSEVHNFISDNQEFNRTLEWTASSVGTNEIIINITIAE